MIRSRALEEQMMCRTGRQLYPEDCELLFREGLLLREAGDRSGAERRFPRLLERREGRISRASIWDSPGFKTRHNLAVLYAEQGRRAEAEAQWQTALIEQPNFRGARAGLEQLQTRMITCAPGPAVR